MSTQAAGQGGIVGSGPAGNAAFPSWEFVAVEWIGNAAAQVAAVYGQGDIDFNFRQCIFRSNVVYSLGGAISVLGSSVSRLLVEDSTFQANAVRASGAGTSDVDVTLRLNSKTRILSRSAYTRR